MQACCAYLSIEAVKMSRADKLGGLGASPQRLLLVLAVGAPGERDTPAVHLLITFGFSEPLCA